MPKGPDSGAVLFARDMNGVARFYQQLISMGVAASHHDHVVLAAQHVELVVHAIPDHIAASIEIAKPPVRRAGMPLKLFFTVASISDARDAAVTLGGSVDPVDSEWIGPGFRACDGQDPEGNVFQIREITC
jgi:predicted enzyme related to lactoylglutathione lyase